jgi:hypothetical protein
LTGDDDTTQGTTQQGEMTEAEIDKNLQDTFPASDPPSWTLGTDHKAPPAKDESDEDEPPHR